MIEERIIINNTIIFIAFVLLALIIATFFGTPITNYLGY